MWKDTSHNLILLAKQIRQVKVANNAIKDDDIEKNPKNKQEMRLLLEVGREISSCFANLNESIETFHRKYYHNRHAINTAIKRSQFRLEERMLDEATDFRDILYSRYDQLAGVAKAFPLTITRPSLKALQQQFNTPTNKIHSSVKRLAPPFYDTIDVVHRTDLKELGVDNETKEDWTVPFVRRHTGKPARVRDPKTSEPMLPSVKCDAYATAIIALSLVFYPQKAIRTHNDEKGRRKSFGRLDLADGLGNIYVYSTGQNSGDVPLNWRGQTWDEAFTKEGGKEKLRKLTRWWEQPSRDKMEMLWHHVWLPAIDGK